MRTVIFICAAVILNVGCDGAGDEQTFFDGDVATRNQRLEALPLPKQWAIFKFGNQRRHPPIIGLAAPIAKRGKTAVYYILGELDRGATDLDIRDSLVVFQFTQWNGYYDLCADEVASGKIKSNQFRIKNSEWRNAYGEMLSGLCGPDAYKSGTALPASPG